MREFHEDNMHSLPLVLQNIMDAQSRLLRINPAIGIHLYTAGRAFVGCKDVVGTKELLPPEVVFKQGLPVNLTQQCLKTTPLGMLVSVWLLFTFGTLAWV